MAKFRQDKQIFQPDAGPAEERGKRGEIQREPDGLGGNPGEDHFGRGRRAEKMLVEIGFSGGDTVGKFFVFRQFADEIEDGRDIGRGRGAMVTFDASLMRGRSICLPIDAIPGMNPGGEDLGLNGGIVGQDRLRLGLVGHVDDVHAAAAIRKRTSHDQLAL